MNTIKLGRTGQIILIIVICLIIAIALFSNYSSKQSETKEDAFSKLRRRLKELQKEIEDEMNTLKLTQEMKDFLETRISRYFMLAKCIFIGSFLTISGLFYASELNVVASLLSSAGVISFACMALYFLILNKFADANAIIKTVQNLIRRWIYKKYRFDPLIVHHLKRQIDAKQMEYSELVKGLEPQVSLSPIPTMIQ